MATDPTPERTALDDASDELLADRAADGDARAFAALVRRYGRLLRNYAVHVLGDPSSSDDVVQEALVIAWQQLDDLRDRSAVRSWLIRITTRRAVDHLRTAKRHTPIEDVEQAAPAGFGPDDLAEAGSLAEALDRALAALPELQRETWVLRELGGYSYEEIAVELDRPISTVRGALARARTRLAHDLDTWR